MSSETSPPDWSGYFEQQAAQTHDNGLRRLFAAGVPVSDTPLSEVPLLALDFETTGMDPERHAIVSIGVVPFSLDRIQPAAGRYWVIRPDRPLDEKSVVFHGITHEQVASAPPLPQVLDEVLATMVGRVPVVHYQHIERPFLNAACQQAGKGHCLLPLIDTMAIEARHARQGTGSWWRRLLQLRQPSIRLADSRARYGLPAYGAHHAKLDALATAELFLAQVARHYSPTTPISELWC